MMNYDLPLIEELKEYNLLMSVELLNDCYEDYYFNELKHLYGL